MGDVETFTKWTEYGLSIDSRAIMEAVQHQFACLHEDQEIRVREQVNATVYAKQCVRCGQHLGTVSKQVVLLDSPSTNANRHRYDEQLRAQWDEQRSAYYSQLQEQARTAVERARSDQDAAWWKRYTAYLESPDWAKRRKLVMERCAGICEGCRERSASQVHHRTYEHVTAEFLFELVALCDGCHQRIHPEKDLLSSPQLISRAAINGGVKE